MTDEQARLRNEILWELEYTDYCRDVLPHYGMVPDFRPRYDRLEQLIRSYLDAEHTQLDEEQRKAQAHERHVQRESKEGETNIKGC